MASFIDGLAELIAADLLRRIHESDETFYLDHVRSELRVIGGPHPSRGGAKSDGPLGYLV